MGAGPGDSTWVSCYVLESSANLLRCADRADGTLAADQYMAVANGPFSSLASAVVSSLAAGDLCRLGGPDLARA